MKHVTLAMEPRGCHALWAAVLARMIHDLCAPGASRTSAARLRRDAERWVGAYPSREFRMVCECAGLEAEAVHVRLRALIALPVAERRETLSGCLDSQHPRRDAPHDKAGPALTLRPLSPRARRDRLARLFRQGVAPADMPAACAAEGHHVTITTVYNDLAHLRAEGRIGFAGRAAPRIPVTQGGGPAHA